VISQFLERVRAKVRELQGEGGGAFAVRVRPVNTFKAMVAIGQYLIAEEDMDGVLASMGSRWEVLEYIMRRRVPRQPYIISFSLEPSGWRRLRDRVYSASLFDLEAGDTCIKTAINACGHEYSSEEIFFMMEDASYFLPYHEEKTVARFFSRFTSSIKENGLIGIYIIPRGMSIRGLRIPEVD